MSQEEDFDTAPEHFVDSLSVMAEEPSENATGNNVSSAGATSATPAVGNASSSASDNIKDSPSEEEGEKIFAKSKYYLNRDSDAYDRPNDIEQIATLITSNGGTLLHEKPTGSDADVLIVSPYNDTNLPTVTSTYIKACVNSKKLLNPDNYLVPYDEFRSVIDAELMNESKNSKDDSENKRENNHEVNVPTADASNVTPSTQSLVQVEDSDIKNNNTDTNTNASNTQMDNVPGGTFSEPDRSPARSVLTRNSLPTHNKANFTEEEDEFILDVVRKNPTRRSTHTLFEEISHYVPSHTGNSIRHRYRVYLSKKLDFVYEVDKYGKLVRDSEGNLIKTKALPPQLKKKFTADQDYALAIQVKKQFYRDLYQIDPDTRASLISPDDSPTAIARRNMTMDPNNVPGQEPSFTDYRTGSRRGPIAREFFKRFGETNPEHSESAWRDRFRKFLFPYGIDAYIEYYEGEKAANREPEPMKNLTTRPKRPGVPTPGNYNSSSKRAKLYSMSKQQASLSAAAAADAANAAASATSNSVDHSNLGVTGTDQAYAIPENELLDQETMDFISSIRNDLSKIDNNLPFEYPQEIADAIRNDFSNEEVQYDNIDPDSIPFPPEIASVDLFLPNFFQMSDVREFMNKVNDVISRDYEPSQAEKLVQDLCDEAGVRRTFSTTILTALSGDLMVFPRYFLNMFKHNANPPMNVPGIWTREDDDMLRSGKEEDIEILEKKHGRGRIIMRKRFIERDLI